MNGGTTEEKSGGCRGIGCVTSPKKSSCQKGFSCVKFIKVKVLLWITKGLRLVQGVLVKNKINRLCLLDPSNNARRLLLHMLSIGSACRTEPEHHKGFEKPGIHLFWVLSGSGYLDVHGTTIKLYPGAVCWLVDMSKPRTYRPADGSRLVTEGLRFYGPNIEAWWEVLKKSNEIQLGKMTALALLRRTFKKLEELVNRRPAGYEWKIHLFLTEVMGCLLASQGILSSQQNERPIAVCRIIDTVLAEPIRDWRVSELAERIGMSCSGLRALFKRVQHEGIHDFLQRVRLDSARLLLCDRNLSVKQIAEHLNFSSEFYFSHFFRSGTGMSPRQFRNQVMS